MNASEDKKIQMNMESIGDSNKLFNSMFSSDGEPIFEEREIMNPKERDILNKYKNVLYVINYYYMFYVKVFHVKSRQQFCIT